MATNETETIIKDLINLSKSKERTSDHKTDKTHKVDKVDKAEPKVENEIYTLCRLLKLHISNFYDDIYVPVKFFIKAKYDVEKVLYENADSLYYNEEYIVTDEERFNEVFDKYVEMIKEILDPNNKLTVYLKKWTSMTDRKYSVINTDSYLRSLLKNEKYRYISPEYITKLFKKTCKENNKDFNKITVIMEKELNSIIKKLKQETKLFSKLYHQIVISYVFEHPSDLDENYSKSFITYVILNILDFAEKLIDMNIYAIHTIVNNVIDYYTPLDDIGQYDPSSNHNLKLTLV